MPADDPHPLYERPPLVEAAIGFRFTRGAGAWGSGLFERILERLTDYELDATLPTHFVQFDATAVSIGSGPETRRFRSREPGRLVLCGPDQLSLSYLPQYLAGGYPGGDALRAEVLRLLDVYRDVTRPDAVSQVGVRYINNLPLAPDGQVIGDVLRDDGELVPRSVLNIARPVVVRTEVLVEEHEAWEQREAVTVALVRPPTAAAIQTLVVDIDESRSARVLPGPLAADAEASCTALQERVYERFRHVFRPELYDSFGPRTAATSLQPEIAT